MFTGFYYSVKAVLRRIVHMLLAALVQEGVYANGPQAGYRGWVKVGRMVLAFRKSDGSLQYRW